MELAYVSTMVQKMDGLKKRILYITYDGLTDPLGQSQILPYLKGLVKHGYEFTVLSFEKKARFQKDKHVIDKIIRESDIRWVPLPFSTRPPLISKLYDALQMRKKAVALHKEVTFDMVHCRSYIAADVGLYLKKKLGVKFFFDMRGFWADERKEGSWDLRNPVYKKLYQHYKQKEAQYLQHADHIISLTEAGKQEMRKWVCYKESTRISVIPCCADMTHFSLTDAEQKKAGRAKLQMPADALVVSYLGSIGNSYMLDEMLQFFKQLKQQYPNARFLFISHSPREIIDRHISNNGLDPNDFVITEAMRKDVPGMIKASDINLSFIKPVYSKLSSSPTKLGEVLSMGIPVIVNSGVGDVQQTVTDANAGYVLQDFKFSDFEKAIEAIPQLLSKTPAAIRSAVESTYNLDKGILKYLHAYRSVL